MENKRPGYEKFIATEFKPVVRDSIRRSKPNPKPIVKTIKTIKTIKTKDADEKKIESQVSKIVGIANTIYKEVESKKDIKTGWGSLSFILGSMMRSLTEFGRDYRKTWKEGWYSVQSWGLTWELGFPSSISKELYASSKFIYETIKKGTVRNSNNDIEGDLNQKDMGAISIHLTKIEKILQNLKSNWQKIFAKELSGKPKSKESNDKVKSSLVSLLESKQSSLKLKGEPKRAYEKALSKLEDREDDFMDSVEEYVDNFINGSSQDDRYSPENLYASYATPNSSKHDVYEDLGRVANKYKKTYTNASIKQWQQAFLKVVLEWSDSIGGDDDWS